MRGSGALGAKTETAACARFWGGVNGPNITLNTPAASADKDHDPDLDTIDVLASMIGKYLSMTGIEAFAAKHAGGAGHVFGRSYGVVHLLDLT